MKYIISSLGFALVFVSCKTNQVSVRLKNISNQDFNKISVSIGNTTKTFEGLKVNASTIEFTTNKAHRYCYTQIITIHNDTLTLQPFDFVGEKTYRWGKILMKFDLELQNDEKTFGIRIKTRRRFIW